MIESTQDIYTDRQLRLMIESKESGETIGTIDLYDFDPFHRRSGVGILVDKRFRKQGYGMQALQLLEAYSFDFLHLHQLYAFIPAGNNISIALFTKSGYIMAGRLKEWLSVGDSFEEVQVMQRVNSE